jgi:hypothetical protein
VCSSDLEAVQRLPSPRKAALYGYIAGKTRRGMIDRERRGVRETILLALERPIPCHPDSLRLIKRLIDGNRRVIGVICSDTAPPFTPKELYLDFDISLLELVCLSHFSFSRFWSDYGHIDRPGTIFALEDRDNCGPKTQTFIRFLREAGITLYA